LKYELGVIRDHWKWHHSINRIRVPISIHCNYGPILYHFRDKARYSVDSYPPASTLPLSGPRRPNIAVRFVTEKLEWCGYPMVKKFEDTFSRFDTIPACERQTDGQTDILQQHSPRYAYASHGKTLIICPIVPIVWILRSLWTVA